MRLFHLLLPSLAASLTSATTHSPLSEDTFKLLPDPSVELHPFNDGSLLKPILIPRIPGSEGSAKVLRHFTDFFTSLPSQQWKITFDNFTSSTPLSDGKEIPFSNFIVTRDPPWHEGREGNVGRLVLAAHFDSKVTPKGFIGATDSAVPCAVIMAVAKAIDGALTAKWDGMQKKAKAGDAQAQWDMEEESGIMILLLDGEEAWHAWTETDSLYGARHLAELWEITPSPTPMATFRTQLHSMQLFVLLDLLGAANPRIPSYFTTTHWAYSKLAALEQKLRKSSVKNLLRAPLKPAANAKRDPKPWFTDKADKKDFMNGFGIEDDHIPFLKRGIEILHLIPTPFPRVWHEMDDDGEHLDINTCRDWAVVMTAWTAEMLGLEGWFGPNPKGLNGSNNVKRDL